MPEPGGPRPGQQTITLSKVLLVEGENERRFFHALLDRLGAHDAIQIINYQGKDRLREHLRMLPTLRGYAALDSLGVTRDADQFAATAFQSVCGSLDNAKLGVPDQTMLATQGRPRVSVFILPDCSNPGMLETLCLSAVECDPAMPCVDEYIRCLEDTAYMPPKNPDKARAHTFLASRTNPDLRVGEAAQAGHWQLDSPVFEPLKSFLQAL